MRFPKSLLGIFVVIATLSAAGIAGATIGDLIRVRGVGSNTGRLICPGGMTNMGYELSEGSSVFPGDPAIVIDDIYTVDPDFFEVERITMSTHVGTHLDVPRHFVEGEAGLTDLAPEEFVWRVYKLDVSKLDLADGQLQIERADIRRYEREFGRIRPGSMVVLDTSVGDEFNLDDAGDEYIVDEDGLSANVDDLFTIEVEGLSEAAVNWLFTYRSIEGVGTDAYGPDASDDDFFLATDATLRNNGVALVALDNVESLNVHGDIIIAPAVRLADSGGFPVNPIACHGAGNND